MYTIVSTVNLITFNRYHKMYLQVLYCPYVLAIIEVTQARLRIMDKELKVKKSLRLDPKLYQFCKDYGAEKRWTDTTVIEVALEELARKAGYMDENGNLKSA